MFSCRIIGFSSSGPLVERINTEQVKITAFNKSAGNDPTLIYKMWKLFRKEKTQIVQTHGWGTMVEGAMASWLAGVPFSLHAERGTIETRPVNLMCQNLCWRMADKVLCVSEEHKKQLTQKVKFPQSRIISIPNGVDTDRFAPRPENKALYRQKYGLPMNCFCIGTVGNLRPVKNQALLIRASQRLIQRDNNIHLVLTGDGNLKGQLVQLTEELKIKGHVHFLGAQKEIPEILNALDVFVLSSLNEGMPNAVLEAMACGLPVVGTRVGGIPEVINSDRVGVLVSSDNPEELCLVLSRLKEDKENREQLSRESRKRIVEEYSLRRMIQAYQNLYLGSVS